MIDSITVKDIHGQSNTYKLLVFPNSKYIDKLKVQFEAADPNHQNYQQLKDYILKFDKTGLQTTTTLSASSPPQKQQIGRPSIQPHLGFYLNNNNNSKNNNKHRSTIDEIPLLNITITSCNKIKSDSKLFSSNIGLGEWNNMSIVVREFNGNIDDILEEFINEFNIIYSIKHSNLVKLYGKCCDGLVFENPEEGSLENILFSSNSNIKIRLSTRLNWLLDIANGMNHLHLNSIIHGNLKLSNSFLNSIGICKLSDYGLLKKGNGNENEKDDVYSFGILLYQLVTIQPIVNQTPIVIPNSISPVLKVLIERCLDEIPSDRPTFQEIVSFISSIIQNSQFLLFTTK